ncbi:MAG: glycosyltransferase involved in cell wall biosynthesis [Paraglaciecola sp.]|jgi:glycosyltransferase involved in cell wall biosynthesis
MKYRLLFLTQKMSLGFGVAVVVHNLSLALRSLGIHVEVACLEKDSSLDAEYPVHLVAASAAELDTLVAASKIDYVIAHTSPFFELLPQLTGGCKRWVWEHGDPTPDLFPFDGAERKKIAGRKLYAVYPEVDQVVAISEFIRSDIAWPDAKIIYNGCDHVVPVPRLRPESGPIRVGTLMRLGLGESFYKGNQLFLDLAKHLSSSAVSVEFHLMGRGTLKDAKPFQEKGITVHLNASDEERSQYLADLDIFVSMSLWEGFNLPLLEAAISGTAAFALDTGAHPEVTPYVFSSVSEMAALITTLATNRNGQLAVMSNRNQRFARDDYSWAQSAKALAVML